MVDGVKFLTAEHFLMYSKAILFHDEDVARKVLNTVSPREVKELGRAVKGFDEKVWEQAREEVALKGNLCKFQQNPSLKDKLLGTRGKQEACE